ncbi:MAG: YdiU family protein [Bradymonadales bacterium]|nr:MAG: YdiU family protein [Bradymonadales bacterium]
MKLDFLQTYKDLGPQFYQEVSPTPVSRPEWIVRNEALAAELNLDLREFGSEESLAVFSGNRALKESSMIAMAYAGHQFGHFVPQLGDGRAILLGELRDGSGQLRDIQLKGAGRTAFSRQGDGRSALGPVIREYILSEWMNRLGVPSTRALAALRTGDSVIRESLLPGGIFVRVASSHIRIGTFEYFRYRGEKENLKKLLDYCVWRHLPELQDSANLALDFLREVAARQAQLVATWMSLGFIHGVMNTDNTSISGETIDYGPCAFLDEFDASKVFSSIDRHARYAFGNQASIAQWNLSCLAEALSPLASTKAEEFREQVEEVLKDFELLFRREWLRLLRSKLGLIEEREKDEALIFSLFEWMQKKKPDFNNFFRSLSEIDSLERAEPEWDRDWLKSWQERRDSQAAGLEASKNLMKNSNPVYIPRNHLVERAIQEAVEEGTNLEFKRLLKLSEKPYDAQEEFADYRLPPKPEEVVQQTFCGT